MVRISRLTGRFLFILTPVNNSSGGFQFSISFIIAAVTKIKKHGRLSMSLFRYGLDYVQMAIQRLIGFGKKEALLKKRVLFCPKNEMVCIGV